jgi:hypothetical protein
MATKNKNIGIFLLIGAAILLSGFIKPKNKRRFNTPDVTMSNVPTGTDVIFIIPGAEIYDNNMALVYTNNSGSYLQVAVLNNSAAPNGMFNIAFGMDFLNAETGFVFFEQTTNNPQ